MGVHPALCKHVARDWVCSLLHVVQNGKNRCVKYRAKICFRTVHVIYSISHFNSSRHDLVQCEMARGFVFSSLVSCEEQDTLRLDSA